MTQEEKLKLAREWYNDPNATQEEKHHLLKLVPELGKNGDEKIKNELIDFIKRIDFIPEKSEKLINWIKKQCVDISSFPEEQRKYMEKYINLDKTTLVKLLAERDENINEILNCENNEISVLEVWKDMRLEAYQQASGNRHEPNCSDDSTKMFSLTDIDEIFEKVAEKQGEQKHLPSPIKNDQGIFPCWNNAHDIRPKHLQRCICYDKYMNGAYCYVYDGISKYWCTQMTEDHDPNGDNHVCDYADYRVTMWMPVPDTSLNVHDKIEPEFKVGDTIVEKDLDECGRGTIVNIKDGKYIFDSGTFIWIKEQGLWQLVKQKHTDKVESKFEIEKGKWYVCNTPRYKDFVVGKEYYCPKNGMLKPNENEMALYVARSCFHPWTIQDVKDGDVLVVGDEDGEGVAICGKDDTIGNNNLYCAYDDENGFIINVKIAKECLLHPATKEQRDTLFARMKESGYLWDAEKKELRKVEDGPSHKEMMIKWNGDNLKEVLDFTGKCKNFDNWFSSFAEYEKYVHEHNNIFKLFDEDGSHCEVPVGSWIVKTPDGYNVAYVRAAYRQNSAWSEKYIADVFEKTGLAKIAREQANDRLTCALQDVLLELSRSTPTPDDWVEDYWQHHKVNNPLSYDGGDEIQFDHYGFLRFCQTYFHK